MDDHSRFALSVTAHLSVTGPIVLATFRDVVDHQGVPASTLTDHGMVFTTRLAGGRGGRNALESELHRLGVLQKNSRPNHPTTCGKVERFQQTMKKWLRAQPHQPTSLAGLQAMLDRFVDHYNHHRPHRSLPESSTPAVAYGARPKATPGAWEETPHDRVRRDRVDVTGSVTLRIRGRLHHIGVGRTNARTPVILLVHDLHVRVIHAATGELLRDLMVDPPGLSTHRGAERADATERSMRREGSEVSDVSRHHMVGRSGKVLARAGTGISVAAPHATRCEITRI